MRQTKDFRKFQIDDDGDKHLFNFNVMLIYSYVILIKQI